MKKKYTALAAVILFVLCAAAGIIVFMQKSESINYTIDNAYEEYSAAPDSIAAAVNDELITEKYLCLVKYSYGTARAADNAIYQKKTVILAETDHFSLSRSEINKEKDYISQIYESLNLQDSDENAAFQEALLQEHLDMATSIRYAGEIERKIMNREFETDNEKISKKYEKYNTLTEKWEKSGKENFVLYSKIRSLREDIAQEYIDYKTAQFNIEEY